MPGLNGSITIAVLIPLAFGTDPYVALVILVGTSSAIVLLVFAPLLAKFALKFGPPEYFMPAILSMSIVIGMAGKNIAKNFLSMALGLWLSCIGMSPTKELTAIYVRKF